MDQFCKQGLRLIPALMVCFVALFCLVPDECGAFNPTKKADKEKRKIILLGFDGVDYHMAKRFMNGGSLPHLQELEEKGSFVPLDTTNPAQSPVAWASVVTGTNPGKTNIGGFIKRSITEINKTQKAIIPQLATIEDSYQGLDHKLSYSHFHWLSEETKVKWIVVFSFAFFLVSFLLLKIILRVKVFICLSGGVIVGAVAAVFGFSFFTNLPDQVPFPYNLQQGKCLWEILDEDDVRSIGLYAPGAYPVVAPKNSEILGGLGVPDVAGGTGTWYIYSSEAFTFFDQDTNTGGKIIRLDEGEEDLHLKGKIFGPSNFFAMDKFKKEIQALKTSQNADKLTDAEKIKAVDDYELKKAELKDWKSDPEQRNLICDFTIIPNYEKKEMTVLLAGQKEIIKEGDWNKDWFKVTFEMSPFLKVPAQVRMRVIKCSDEEVRFFIPSIDISPESPPPYLRLSSPPEFSAQIAKKVGAYETVGWSCITHGLKDNEIDECVFMEDVEFTMKSRRKLMRNQLERKDWDFFFETFYTTDRVQHMMYRLYDSNHPQFDPLLAEKEVTHPFFDNKIKLKDSVFETYKVMDSIIGEVMDRINDGDFGEDPVLMIISDHGFAPFYYSVGINNFLIEKGFLVTKPDSSGKPMTVKAIIDSGMDELFAYIDWSKTRAYSMGLGKIFINKEGREPNGIVTEEEYESLRDEIIKEFTAYKDPITGKRIMKQVYKRDEIFSGDFWKEGEADYLFYGPDGRKISEKRRTDGYADLFLGFYPKYRVSWQTSLGGLEDSVIVPNDQKWSGDHVSVDPSEVQGVFFCNKKMKGGIVPCLNDIAPTVLDIYGLKQVENLDGKPIRLDL